MHTQRRTESERQQEDASGTGTSHKGQAAGSSQKTGRESSIFLKHAVGSTRSSSCRESRNDSGRPSRYFLSVHNDLTTVTVTLD